MFSSIAWLVFVCTTLDKEFSHITGLTGLIVSQDPGSADTPRAHMTNMAALGMCLITS